MIKFLILIVASFLILSAKSNLELPVCNFRTAKQAIPPRIFAEQTIDGPNQPIIFTRFIHNKFGIYGSEFTKCYFFSLDPNFIYHTTGIGIIFFLYFIYAVLVKKQYILLIIFLIIPAVPFFRLPITLVFYVYKLFAIIGLTFLLFKKR